MYKKPAALFLALGLSAAVFTASQQARAALGGSADSVESDGNVLSAVHRAATEHGGYTVKEIDVDSTLVREYISPAGLVFGIAWNGLTHPDLTQLLGSYDAEYREALQHTPRKPGNRRLQVKAEGVIVEKWGHMRNLRGRAYAPALIPPGVSVDAIK